MCIHMHACIYMDATYIHSYIHISTCIHSYVHIQMHTIVLLFITHFEFGSRMALDQIGRDQSELLMIWAISGPNRFQFGLSQFDSEY